MNLLNKTGLTYFWGKLKAFFVKGNARVFYGTCATAAGTAAKEVVCSAFSSADLANGTMILVKFDNANSASNVTLDVNGTGAYSVRYVRNTEVTGLVNPGDIRGFVSTFVYSTGSTNPYWLYIGCHNDTNTTYSSMTQAEIDAGTGTTGRRITPALLRDNFYLKSEIPIFVHLTDESDMPATPDANTIYMIDE